MNVITQALTQAIEAVRGWMQHEGVYGNQGHAHDTAQGSVPGYPSKTRFRKFTVVGVWRRIRRQARRDTLMQALC